MEIEIKKILTHQIVTGQTEDQMCDEIGITSRTLRNIKVGKFGSKTTENKIKEFISDKGL